MGPAVTTVGAQQVARGAFGVEPNQVVLPFLLRCEGASVRADCGGEHVLGAVGKLVGRYGEGAGSLLATRVFLSVIVALLQVGD